MPARSPFRALLPLAGALGLTLSAAAPLLAQDQAQRRLNRTIETLESGKPVFGLATGDFSLINARSLATSALDFVIIDMEHNPLDIETLQRFIMGMVNARSIAAKGFPQMDVTPIVRLPVNGREQVQYWVKQALDVGAYGVMFPMVETREEALNAVQSMRYPQPRGDAQAEPVGIRGSSPGNAAWIWGVPDYSRRADTWPLDKQGELLAVIQIETVKGVRNADAIVSTPGLGALFIGPADLALSYGLPGNSPEVEAGIQTVLAACKKYNVRCGLTTSAGNVAQRLQQGFDFVTISWGGDAGISGAAENALNVARQAAGRN
jgi:4-hydroxy-2-oxoheptanedioate aldolase